MASGGKTAEIRAGIVVLVGLVVLAIGLYIVSGGGDRFKEKNRLTVHFRDAGGIGGGANIYVAGQRAGEVVDLETVMFTYEGVRSRWVAVTIEIRKNIEIPIDSTFKISKSITNVVQMNIDYGTSNVIARESTDNLVGKRLANVDELVDSYQDLAGVAKKGAEEFNELISTAHGKIKELDIKGMQDEARTLLRSLQETATDVQGLVRDNRSRVDHILMNVDDVTGAFKNDWATMSTKAQDVLDKAREAAAEVTGILKENREGLKSIVQRLDDAAARMGPVFANMEAITRAANDAVIEMRPGLARGLASASKAFENFQSLTEDLKAAPWKLVNKPSDKESDDVHLYNAARNYVDAAGRVAVAVQDLETLRRLGVLGDASRADLIEKTLTTMQEALAEFEANQKRFSNLIAATAGK
ncbi:MAG TPA: MlaD family protein [Planctomycetota bacterium]|nr:MlaD family protein [Planctomycetota bacterium]